MKRHFRRWWAYWGVAIGLCCIGVILVICAVIIPFVDNKKDYNIMTIVPGFMLILLSLPVFFISQSVYFFERKQEPKPDVMESFLDRAEETIKDTKSTEKKQ